MNKLSALAIIFAIATPVSFAQASDRRPSPEIEAAKAAVVEHREAIKDANADLKDAKADLKDAKAERRDARVNARKAKHTRKVERRLKRN